MHLRFAANEGCESSSLMVRATTNVIENNVGSAVAASVFDPFGGHCVHAQDEHSPTYWVRSIQLHLSEVSV